MVAEAVASLYLDQVEVPDTGSLSEDLITLLSQSYRLWPTVPVGCSTAGSRVGPEPRAGRRRPLDPLRPAALVRHHVEPRHGPRGLAPDLDQELLLDLLLGPLGFRLLVSGAPITPEAAR